MELKPCPFCGANAELQTNMFAGDSCCWIECLRCGTEGPLSDTVKLPEAQDQAIAKWNRRAQLAAPDLRATFRDTMDSLDMAELAVQQTSRISDLESLVRRLLADHQRVEPHHADECALCREAQAAIDGTPAQGERQPDDSRGFCMIGSSCACTGEAVCDRAVCPSWISA